MNPKYELTIYTDGGSRGNPGPAAYGFVITDSDKQPVYEEGKTIGIDTNNVAEYSAIVNALRWVETNTKTIGYKPSTISFFMDSMLCAQQLSGKWKIKNENLRALYFTIKDLERRIEVPVTYSHVRREFNKEADRMVNLALDGLV